MRFKTRDLMINVLPQEETAVLCAFTPEQCFEPTAQICWHSPCRYTPCRYTPVECAYTPLRVCLASPMEFTLEMTRQIRTATPQVVRQPAALETLKQELATTQQMLEELETQVDVPARLAEAERVEAGLEEALEQVREQKRVLAERAREEQS